MDQFRFAFKNVSAGASNVKVGLTFTDDYNTKVYLDVADAKKRADAAEAAMAAGKDAYEQLVAALGSGDEAAAAVAADALNAALEAAINALAGVFPQEEQGGAPAGQGKADGVVNIFKKLWDSKGKQVVEEGEFNIQLDTTPSLEGEDGPDGGGGEATPV